MNPAAFLMCPSAESGFLRKSPGGDKWVSLKQNAWAVCFSPSHCVPTVLIQPLLMRRHSEKLLSPLCSCEKCSYAFSWKSHALLTLWLCWQISFKISDLFFYGVFLNNDFFNALCDFDLIENYVFFENNIKALIASCQVFPGGSDGEDSACNAGDPVSISGSGRSPGEGNDNPLQFSCLENHMDGVTWRATPHGVAKGQTWLSN